MRTLDLQTQTLQNKYVCLSKEFDNSILHISTMGVEYYEKIISLSKGYFIRHILKSFNNLSNKKHLVFPYNDY